jgi:type I restriction enzyme S subunit
MNKIKYKTYPAYKNSSVEWLGEIPEGWEVKRLGTHFAESKTKVSDKDYPPLSVTKQGILPQLENAAKSNDGDNRKLVKEGDFVINSRSDRKGSSGIAYENGSVSLINIVMKPKNFNRTYTNYLLKGYSFIEEFYRNGHGIVADLWTTRYDEMKNIKIPIPPISEQTAIATFLDRKTELIDKAITNKEKLIVLLKERKQILIQNAVTGKVVWSEKEQQFVPIAQSETKSKDSGVEWIGEIPEGWEVKRCKYLFYEVAERSIDGKEELLSVSHMTGITPRSEKEIYMFMAEDYTGSKICRDGDLVYNIMWAWMGALGVSYQTGIVSPSYGVYRMKKKDFFNKKFIEYKLKTIEYIEYYNRVSTGLHSSRLRFYANMFMNMEIAFPSRKKQDEIIDYIETQSTKIDRAIALQQTQIEKLKEYKSVLIDSAVTGKVKVS